MNDKKQSDEFSEMLDKCLSSREAELIKRIYGLDGSAPMSIEDACRESGIPRERFKQIAVKPFRKGPLTFINKKRAYSQESKQNN